MIPRRRRPSKILGSWDLVLQRQWSLAGKGVQQFLGGGNSNMFSIFTPIAGEMIQFDEHIFQWGWNHQLVVIFFYRFYHGN